VRNQVCIGKLVVLYTHWYSTLTGTLHSVLHVLMEWCIHEELALALLEQEVVVPGLNRPLPAQLVVTSEVNLPLLAAVGFSIIVF